MEKKSVFRLITLLFLVFAIFEYIIKGYFPFLRYTYTIPLIVLVAFISKLFLDVYSHSKKKDIMKKLVFLCNFVIASFLFFYLYPNLSLFARVFLIIASTVYLYMLLLSLNVYIVSHNFDENLPLLQPSRLIVFIMIILNVFLTANYVYKLPFFNELPEVNFGIKCLLLIGYFIFTFLYLDWYFITEAGEIHRSDIKLLPNLKVFSIYISTSLAIILMFFPFENFGRALILTTFIYCIVTFTNLYISHRFTSSYYIFSLTLLTLTYIFVYFL